MSGPATSVEAVLSVLEAQGHLPPGRRADAEAMLARLEDAPPWYVRAMIAFGAWLASLSFMSFVMGVSLFATEGGFLATGAIFVVAAAVVRHRLDYDFSNQAALAMSLAGQVLIAVGVAKFGSNDSLEPPLLALIGLNAALIPLYPDRTHRFLSVIFMTAALVVLVYKWGIQDVLPFVAPVLAAAYVWLTYSDARFVTRGRDALTWPISAGLMVSAFGVVLLAAVYVLPELAREFQFYPRPWISTLGFGALLLYIEHRELSGSFGKHNGARLAFYVVTMLVVVAALPAPGLVLSLVVVLMGAARGDRLMVGAGTAFLTVFTAAFFYGIETTLLVKSVILIATGTILLVGQWCLFRLLQAGEGSSHA